MSSWLTGMCHKTVSPISRDNLRACGLVRFNAAALASLRRSRRRAYELLRIQIKLLFAPGAAEVIRLPVVLGSSSGNSRFEVHTAHGIFHRFRILHDFHSSDYEWWSMIARLFMAQFQHLIMR